LANILYLTIKKKYFDLIASEKKKIEYRAFTPFYHSRLGKQYDEIKFVNGRHSKAPFIRAELDKIKKYRNRYLIYIGNILEIYRGE
jgi:ASC-1-like (ASCH) protein